MARAQSRSGVAIKTNPELWEKSKKKAVAKLGGKWSARAAQLAVRYYKDAGGGYRGPRPTPGTNKLTRWSAERWGYVNGKKGGRYLPEGVRKRLSKSEGIRTNTAKKVCTRKGQQWCRQPRDVAKKASKIRKSLKFRSPRLHD